MRGPGRPRRTPRLRAWTTGGASVWRRRTSWPCFSRSRRCPCAGCRGSAQRRRDLRNEQRHFRQLARRSGGGALAGRGARPRTLTKAAAARSQTSNTAEGRSACVPVKRSMLWHAFKTNGTAMESPHRSWWIASPGVRVAIFAIADGRATARTGKWVRRCRSRRHEQPISSPRLGRGPDRRRRGRGARALHSGQACQTAAGKARKTARPPQFCTTHQTELGWLKEFHAIHD